MFEKKPSQILAKYRQTNLVTTQSIAQGINTYINSHPNISALLPTVKCLQNIKLDCKNFLPELFDEFEVTAYQEGSLTITMRNAAQAAKLRHWLPKLQDALQKRGWQINVVKLRLQVKPFAQKISTKKSAQLSPTAIKVLSALANNLKSSPLKDQVTKFLKKQ